MNRVKRLDRSDFYYLAFFETQDFRPPEERELIFTAYAYRGGEVMGLDLETGEIRNYSQNWAYDEAEGVFPDGRFVAVEREPGTLDADAAHGRIDLWQTALDGSGETKRLTHFSGLRRLRRQQPGGQPGWATDGVPAPRRGRPHGNGQGIFLYDFARAAAPP